jgi:hypothetical protein
MRWSEFEGEASEMAAEGKHLFTQHGPGLAYLATIRPDGGPRLHPMCPLFAQGGLFAFLVPSPKQRDLARDGRFAMHAFPADEVDDEFCVTGTAREIGDRRLRDAVAEVWPPARDEDHLFEFEVATALLARYRFRDDWPPTYTSWREPISV